MPVSYRWYDEGSIFIVEYKGEIMPEDVRPATAAFCAHLNASNHPLHLIVDWRQASGSPLNFKNIFETVPALAHKNMGMVGVVGMNSFLSFWAEYLTKLAALRYVAYDTPEAAAAFLRQQTGREAHTS